MARTLKGLCTWLHPSPQWLIKGEGPFHGTSHHTCDVHMTYVTTPTPGPPSTSPLQTCLLAAAPEVPTGGGVVHIAMEMKHSDTSGGRCGQNDVGFK